MSQPSGDLAELVQRGFRFAYSLTHDAARSDDLLQEAWLSVLKARGPWTVEYLFTAIRNRFIDECRRRQIISFATIEETDELGTSAADAAQGDGCDSVVDPRELHRVLGGLRVEERAVLFLSAVEGFSAQRIADFLGWPRGTVLSLMHRARQRAREAAAGRGAAL